MTMNIDNANKSNDAAKHTPADKPGAGTPGADKSGTGKPGTDKSGGDTQRGTGTKDHASTNTAGKSQAKTQSSAQAKSQANTKSKPQSNSNAQHTSSGKASRFVSTLIDRILGKDLSPWLDLIQTDLRQACGLLTRLPLPTSATAHIKTGTAPRFYWAFPLVGVIIAGLAAAPLLLLTILPIPNFLLAVFILLLAALLTGALHEDGLADLADSLGGQSPKARLAIMRDSSIGTFGVLALVIIVVVHVGALTVMIGSNMLGGWVAAAAISRAMMVLQAWMHPPARSSGIGNSSEAGLTAVLGQPSQTVVLVCLALATLVSFIFAGGLATFLAMLIGLVVSFIMGVFTRAHLGGVTGDALGATQQITSAVAMIVMVASA
ncbi:MAG: adenosylcobinamide-GDP ribazoletransferase [Proteobacteria bacterium]|nr:adenosylcobinamide-GDP ribazoletransferase [Pseudomonadota bacterium]